MKTIIHKSQDRGHANHGWLDSYHSFSFGEYYDAKKMQFGKLRVINDDFIAKGAGFGKHPHQNMEIITIMLSGTLKHEDSMGNAAEIKAGEIQVMSAGSGVFHSEFNASQSEDVNLFQIWILPNRLNVEPRYDQKTIKDLAKPNELYQILSPNQGDQGVWIHQDAWFFLGEFDDKKEISYQLKKPGNVIYILVIEGSLNLENQELTKRDAIGISETNSINFTVKKQSKILLMEVPL
jgi:redox-sensitive bicupin YhaK (pirin superfamily)